MKPTFLIYGLIIGALSIAIHSCSKDYMEQHEANMVFNAVESRYIIADSIVCFSSNVEQLSTGESAPENSRVIDIYTIKGPSYINAGVKARVRYVTGGQILSISTYGVCSYGSCSWVPNLVTFVPVGTRYALKVSGTLSFSDDLASMLGKTEQYVNVEDIYFDTKL